MRRRHAIWIGAAFLVIGAVHLGVARDTHALHVVHVVFGALYLLPIVAAAVWLGGKAGLAMALASAGAYVFHARTAWAGDPMENANQLATAGVYVFVGAVSAALVAAAERERKARIEAERAAQRDAVIQAIASLSGALRQRDDMTGSHCARVARIAALLGESVGLAPERIHLLRLAALVHDVGKIGVRDDVLFKPGELTGEERGRIERHPSIAAEILRPIRGAEEIADIVLSHHECPDGTGYPRRLVAEQLPVEARVLRIADVFAALVEPRPYKPSMLPAVAVARLGELKGKVDADCLSALERLVREGRFGGEDGGEKSREP